MSYEDCKLHDTVINALVREQESAIVVFDPSQPNAPIVAMNDSFCKMVKSPHANFVGTTFADLLCELPQWAKSRSAQQNFANFCSTCSKREVSSAGETFLMQSFPHRDGSLFMGQLSLGFCVVQDSRFVVGSLIKAGDVMTRLSSAQLTQLADQALDILHRARARGIHAAQQRSVTTGEGNLDMCGSKTDGVQQKGSAFFGSRLPDCAVLLHGGRTAMRREPDEVANGCLVFGSHPLQQTVQGLSFAVQVDGVSSRFKSLPSIGVTRREPTSNMLFPRVAKCLAESILIGGTGEASVRDQNTNFKIGFRAPPPSEVMTWSSQLPEDLKINEGDILECIYTWEGRIQLFLNSTMLLDFDVERPLDRHALYYPVVDVSGAASMLSFLPAFDSPTVGNLSTCIPDDWELEDSDEDDVARQMSCESLLSNFSDHSWSSNISCSLPTSDQSAEAGDFGSAQANSSPTQAMLNGLKPQGVLAKAAPIAGLAGILVLNAASRWHHSFGHIVDEL